MIRSLKTFEQTLSKASMACAATAVLLIMVIGAADVIAQLVARPMPFKLELSEVLFAVSIFLAWPAVQSKRVNISVDIFAAHYRPRMRRALDILSDLFGLAVFGLITYSIWKLALISFAIRESAVGYLKFPVYPFKIFCAVGATLTVVVLLLQLMRCFAADEMEGQDVDVRN